MDDELKSKMAELSARIEEQEERLAVVEDVARLLYAKLSEMESALLALHDRTSTCELAVERARDLLRVMSDAVDALVRRAAGGRPPSGPFPLSGVN
jgi:uncharacterized coiled-coil protein SlyX